MTLEDVTLDTLEEIKKAQTTGIISSSGLVSYDLTGLVRLIPVVTPFRDKVTRKQSSDGAKFCIWRAFLDVNNQQPSPFPGYDYAANEVIFSEQDFQAQYQPLGLAGMVTQDAQDLARGLADMYAESTMQVLSQTLIAEDKSLIGAQSFALARPSAPTLATATTGGSIGNAVTVYVGVAARTGTGYYYGLGNSRGNSANITTGAGATNSVTASIPAVKGAVAYDWFYSANGTTWFYYTTTTAASVTITATIAANNTVPVSSALPDISTAVPSYNSAADNGSAQPNQFDGFLATLSADYNASGQWVTSGTGTANGATFVDGGGAALTLSGGSVAQIEALFASLWNKVKCSPTALMMNAAQAQEIANLILGSSSATTFLSTDESGRLNVTAGGKVGQIVNTPAGGVTVPIEVHTSLPPGQIIARTDRVPFPQANIANPLEVRTLRDMAQYEYATARVANQSGGGPRKEFEIRSVEAFVNRAPVAMGVLANVA
ncbi:MAG: hypothetical protein ACTHMS_13285 [Jatrophihabitans sp.]|uniref:hypothetical protein n=1 Tax=Jatrophihabitans sp. TaxID=1932789 RepID=UPI003F800A78